MYGMMSRLKSGYIILARRAIRILRACGSSRISFDRSFDCFHLARGMAANEASVMDKAVAIAPLLAITAPTRWMRVGDRTRSCDRECVRCLVACLAWNSIRDRFVSY